MSRDDQKRAAAEAAVALVQDGMVVGLGTGSTAAFAIEALAERVREGLRIVGIPTSERSAAQARDGGIPLTSFADHRRIALTIDGADEIARGSLDLIKGLGGALLREKIVAAASDRLVIVADAAKLVDRLGAPDAGAGRGGAVRLGDHGGAARRAGREPGAAAGRRRSTVPHRRRQPDPRLRLRPDRRCGRAGNALSGVIGVVETGLFIGMAEMALVADEGVHRLTRDTAAG